MTPIELIRALRRLKVQTGSLACLGCGYEHDCGIHGCRIMREAVILIEQQTARIAEQDYWQDVLDRKLHEIFPDSYGFAPFPERYPFIKEVRY